MTQAKTIFNRPSQRQASVAELRAPSCQLFAGGRVCLLSGVVLSAFAVLTPAESMAAARSIQSPDSVLQVALLEDNEGIASFARTPCDDPLSVETLNTRLDSFPERIVGFEHAAVQTELETLAGRLPCLLDPIPPETLARVWFLLGIARIYRFDETGTLLGDGRAIILETFSMSLRANPKQVWDNTVFGDFGIELWQDALALRNGALSRSYHPPQDDGVEVWLDGQLIRSYTTQVSVEPGLHLIQTRRNNRLRAQWWMLKAGDIPGPLPLPAAEAEGPTAKSSSRAVVGTQTNPSGDDSSEQAPDARALGAASRGSIETTLSAQPLVVERSPAVGFQLQVWHMPLTYLGPAVQLDWPLVSGLGLTVGAGLGMGALEGEGQEARALVPVHAGLFWALSPADAMIQVQAGAAWQGYLGGGFGSVLPGAGPGVDHPTSALAQGGVLQVTAQYPIGAVSLSARVSGGMVVWPGTLVAPQLSGGLGITWQPLP